MSDRSPEDVGRDLQNLDHAHIQNETNRDSFVALAHTALFAASISFIGGIQPASKIECKFLLIIGWVFGVIGLLALTASFVTSRIAIDKHREQIYENDIPNEVWTMRLNNIALWTFPASLLCLFVFVVANVL